MEDDETTAVQLHSLLTAHGISIVACLPFFAVVLGLDGHLVV